MLIIALPQKAQTNGPNIYNYWLSPNGLSISLSGQASAQLLPKNAGEVVAVIPWQLVSWHSVKIPAATHLNAEKITALLHGLLEDQLLDDVQSVHFILPIKMRELIQAGREVLVGACSKDWLRQATQALQELGVNVQRIVCELSPLASADVSSPFADPSQSERTTVDGQTSTAVLHVIGPASSAAATVLCTQEGVTRLPSSTSDWSAFKALGSPSLTLLCEPQWVQSTSETLGREPKLHSVSQRMLAAAQSNWDGATGEWAQSKSLRFWRGLHRQYIAFAHHSQWSLARSALTLLILVNILGLNAWSWMQSSSVREREAALSRLLKETFPSIGLIVDPSLQMQREMRRLRHSRGQSAAGDLEAMLGAISTHLPANYKLQSFSYSANELRLNAVSKDLISPQSQIALEKLGYTVRGENTTLGGQTVAVLVMTFVDAASSK